MKKRKISRLLVTGGAGFIGSAFIRYLLKTPHLFSGDILNLDALTYAGHRQNLHEIETDPRYHFIQGDIRNTALVEHLCEDYAIDTIVHFAAESHVDRSIAGPQPFVETNVLGTISLLVSVRSHPHIHFHHISTDEVFGSLGREGEFHEESPYRPNSPYSASKAASDHFVRAYTHTYGISTCLSHCSNNFGPFQNREKLIPRMILQAISGEPLPLYGTGTHVRDWLYVDDHVEAIWLLLRQGKKGETYAIGGGCEMRNREVIHAILTLLAPKLGTSVATLEALITPVPDRLGHDFRYAIDPGKMERTFGWRPRYRFIDALEKTVDWYLVHEKSFCRQAS